MKLHHYRCSTIKTIKCFIGLIALALPPPALAAYDSRFAFLRDEQTGARFTAWYRAP